MMHTPVTMIVRKNLWNASIWLEKHWTERVAKDSKTGIYREQYTIKQRNCAYKASNISYTFGDSVVYLLSKVGIDARKWKSREVLDSLASIILYGIFLLTTDGMHFQDLDPVGLLEICDEIDAENLAK